MAENSNGLVYTGKVVEMLLPESGTSASGKAWVVQTYIMERMEGQYSRKLAVEVFGEQRIKDLALEVGGTYEVSIDLESREYNGRWYTSARAWRASRLDNKPAPQPAQQEAPQPEQTAQIFAGPQAVEETALPF